MPRFTAGCHATCRCCLRAGGGNPFNRALLSNGRARATFRLSEIPGVDVGADPLLSPDVAEDVSAASALLEVPEWRLKFLLQSSADPSLLVAAEQVWRDGGALARWLGRPQAPRLPPQPSPAPGPTAFRLEKANGRTLMTAFSSGLDRRQVT